tara:strand:- start:15397 stop:15501 length:105 start_codon:yes stop_codon:yes gene_type:complete
MPKGPVFETGAIPDYAITAKVLKEFLNNYKGFVK